MLKNITSGEYESGVAVNLWKEFMSICRKLKERKRKAWSFQLLIVRISNLNFVGWICICIIKYKSNSI